MTGFVVQGHISIEQTKSKALKSEENSVLLVWVVPLMTSLPDVVFSTPG